MTFLTSNSKLVDRMSFNSSDGERAALYNPLGR